MASGTPVLASPEALTGLAARDGKDVALARSAGDWSNSLIALFDDACLRFELARAGRDYVEKNHSWERCLSGLNVLLPQTADGHSFAVQ
jgi:glycosyltransferase involved in cell wall biosynthesis